VHRRLIALLVVAFLVGTAAVVWSQIGLQAYVVRTGSMSPTIQPGDAVLDTAGHPDLRRGEVVTFRLADGGLVTHRVHAIRGDAVKTKGDANRTPDPWTVAPDQVVGTVRHTLPRMGYVMVYLQQPAGIGSLVSALLALFLAWQLFFGSDTRPAQGSRRKSSGTASLA
jgi:signal peptidase I